MRYKVKLLEGKRDTVGEARWNAFTKRVGIWEIEMEEDTEDGGWLVNDEAFLREWKDAVQPTYMTVGRLALIKGLDFEFITPLDIVKERLR